MYIFIIFLYVIWNKPEYLHQCLCNFSRGYFIKYKCLVFNCNIYIYINCKYFKVFFQFFFLHLSFRAKFNRKSERFTLTNEVKNLWYKRIDTSLQFVAFRRLTDGQIIIQYNKKEKNATSIFIQIKVYSKSGYGFL